MPTVLLDLDNTLINTDSTTAELQKLLKQHNLQNSFDKLYLKAKNLFGYANLNYVLKELEPELRLQKISKNKIIATITEVEPMPRAKELIELLIEQQAIFYIFTDGNKNIQLKKIANLNKIVPINKNHVIVEANKAEKILETIDKIKLRDKRLIIIDDKLKVLETIREKLKSSKFEYYLIWHCFGSHNKDYLNNKKLKTTVGKNLKIKPCLNLKEVIKILKRNLL
ncbi:MAG: hypothetical protein KatS3mg090_0034 [Patescibacteria group bacterium]|nr:MAG: hypothetical protein KatS3mg090_0034 [Patescibacteria group bacterium]